MTVLMAKFIPHSISFAGNTDDTILRHCETKIREYLRSIQQSTVARPKQSPCTKVCSVVSARRLLRCFA